MKSRGPHFVLGMRKGGGAASRPSSGRARRAGETQRPGTRARPRRGCDSGRARYQDRHRPRNRGDEAKLPSPSQAKRVSEVRVAQGLVEPLSARKAPANETQARETGGRGREHSGAMRFHRIPTRRECARPIGRSGSRGREAPAKTTRQEAGEERRHRARRDGTGPSLGDEHRAARPSLGERAEAGSGEGLVVGRRRNRRLKVLELAASSAEAPPRVKCRPADSRT
jgi:hypothetical protein